jgi:hypothetical protein
MNKSSAHNSEKIDGLGWGMVAAHVLFQVVGWLMILLGGISAGLDGSVAILGLGLLFVIAAILINVLGQLIEVQREIRTLREKIG